MPYFYGIDLSYVILVLPAMLFALWAQFYVNSTFNRYQKVQNLRGMTGEAAARAILNENGLYDIKIEHVKGNLSDHYDPKAGVIRLSDAVYDKSSVAAVGVAAHEAGHAVQHATGYVPIRIRSAIIPVTNFASSLSTPLFLIGILFSMTSLAYLGVFLFGISTLFQLITLPVEFNASSRALKSLAASHYLEEDEQKAARKTLSAAALTYVASLAVSLGTFLRLLLIANGRSRRR